MKDKISIYDKNINSLKLTDLKFIKSLDFVSNLIKDLGDKMGNLKSKKAMLVTPRNNQNKMIFWLSFDWLTVSFKSEFTFSNNEEGMMDMQAVLIINRLV